MGEAKRKAAANKNGAISANRKTGATKAVRRRLLPARLTWKSVVLFLLTLALLDLALYLIFEFGLGQCYGVLCLF